MGNSANAASFVESWNGRVWSIISSVDSSGGLENISCIKSTKCITVGYAEPGTGPAVQTLVEMLNGNTWSAVPTPSPSDNQNIFYGVSCLRRDSCIAVGFSGDNRLTGQADQTLVETGR